MTEVIKLNYKKPAPLRKTDYPGDIPYIQPPLMSLEDVFSHVHAERIMRIREHQKKLKEIERILGDVDELPEDDFWQSLKKL